MHFLRAWLKIGDFKYGNHLHKMSLCLCRDNLHELWPDSYGQILVHCHFTYIIISDNLRLTRKSLEKNWDYFEIDFFLKYFLHPRWMLNQHETSWVALSRVQLAERFWVCNRITSHIMWLWILQYGSLSLPGNLHELLTATCIIIFWLSILAIKTTVQIQLHKTYHKLSISV